MPQGGEPPSFSAPEQGPGGDAFVTDSGEDSLIHLHDAGSFGGNVFDKDDSGEGSRICMHSGSFRGAPPAVQPEPAKFGAASIVLSGSAQSASVGTAEQMEEDEIEETVRSMFRRTFCEGCTLAVFGRIGLVASMACVFWCSLWQYIDMLQHSLENPAVDSITILARLTDVFMSGGALTAAPFLCVFTRYTLLGQLDSLLVGCGCLDAAKQTQRSIWKNAPSLGAFAVSVVLRFRAEHSLCGDTWPAPIIGVHGAAFFRTMTFAFSIAALVVVARLLQALGDIMVILIDFYGSRSVFGMAGPVELRKNWMVMQAKFRQAMVRCEPCIAILVVTVTLCMTTSLLAVVSARPGQLRDFWVLIFTTPLALVTMSFFVRAAEVTARCRRIPSLISSSDAMVMEADERFHLVHHISFSNPGFYVREVIISTGMLMKTGHFMLVAASAVLSRHVTSDT